MTVTIEHIPAAPEPVRAARPLEHVETEIVALASQIAAASCRLLVLVGEFDAANGAAQWGMTSTAAWLSWRCGMGRRAGREQVRVARALRALPFVAERFAAGGLSYSKVRAITRIATPEEEARLVEWAEHATAAQIERLVAASRRVARRDDAAARHAQRYLSYHWDDDGSLIGSFRIPPEQAVEFLAALDAARDALGTDEDTGPASRRDDPAVHGTADPPAGSAEPSQPDTDRESPAPWGAPWATSPFTAEFISDYAQRLTERYPSRLTAPVEPAAEPTAADASERGGSAEPSRPGRPARDLDALLLLARRGLTGSEDAASGLEAELVVHTTPSALARDEDDDATDATTTNTGVRLHPETARRLSCDCPVSQLTVDDRDQPLHLGRRTRRITGRLRRAVRLRDRGRCQAPGCARKATQIHHVRHWIYQGTTCLPNLISLCEAHHWLVHEGGWHIIVKRPGAWRFLTGDGRWLDTDYSPPLAMAPLQTDPDIPPDAVTGHWDGTHLNVNDVLAVLRQG